MIQLHYYRTFDYLPGRDEDYLLFMCDGSLRIGLFLNGKFFDDSYEIEIPQDDIKYFAEIPSMGCLDANYERG